MHSPVHGDRPVASVASIHDLLAGSHANGPAPALSLTREDVYGYLVLVAEALEALGD